MNCSIAFVSRTGNTAKLARRILSCLPAGTFCGAPCAAAAEADLIFAGFWTDKGGCGDELASFLRSLKNKRVFLFGTAGFGGDPAYFQQILDRVSADLDGSNRLVGSYLCTGEMPAAVRDRYEAMAADHPAQAARLLAVFDKAVGHPDDADLAALEAAVRAVL